MRPKSCKSAKNRQKNFIRTLFCYLDPSEQIDFTENCTRGHSSRTRAPSNSDVDFLLSQVSHTSPKTRIYFEKKTTPNLYVTVYFPPSFLYFSSLKANKP